MIFAKALEKGIYGFCFGTGMGLSFTIIPKNTTSWPDSAYAEYYQQRFRQTERELASHKRPIPAEYEEILS